MSSIAYITDSKLLDNHRLHENKQMNFWRLSNKTSFSDFGDGDLVFFLSKDKAHMSLNKEKGIVGFGKLKSINIGSPKAMWKKFDNLNGYNTYEEFVEAIGKVNLNEIPEKISSFYLENVTFFQNPIYLSECGMTISKNIESYIYLDDKATYKILEYSKHNSDLWSTSPYHEERIVEEEISLALSMAHKKVGDVKFDENKKIKVRKLMQKCIDTHNGFSFIRGSGSVLYHAYDKYVSIIMYKDKDVDLKTLVGAAYLYRKYIATYYPHPLTIIFKTIDNDEEFDELVN